MTVVPRVGSTALARRVSGIPDVPCRRVDPPVGSPTIPPQRPALCRSWPRFSRETGGIMQAIHRRLPYRKLGIVSLTVGLGAGIVQLPEDERASEARKREPHRRARSGLREYRRHDCADLHDAVEQRRIPQRPDVELELLDPHARARWLQRRVGDVDVLSGESRELGDERAGARPGRSSDDHRRSLRHDVERITEERTPELPRHGHVARRRRTLHARDNRRVPRRLVPGASRCRTPRPVSLHRERREELAVLQPPRPVRARARHRPATSTRCSFRAPA